MPIRFRPISEEEETIQFRPISEEETTVRFRPISEEETEKENVPILQRLNPLDPRNIISGLSSLNRRGSALAGGTREAIRAIPPGDQESPIAGFRRGFKSPEESELFQDTMGRAGINLTDPGRTISKLRDFLPEPLVKAITPAVIGSSALAGTAGSLAGMTADIFTDPRQLILLKGLGKAIPAIGKVPIGKTTLGDLLSKVPIERGGTAIAKSLIKSGRLETPISRRPPSVFPLVERESTLITPPPKTLLDSANERAQKAAQGITESKAIREAEESALKLFRMKEPSIPPPVLPQYRNTLVKPVGFRVLGEDPIKTIQSEQTALGKVNKAISIGSSTEGKPDFQTPLHRQAAGLLSDEYAPLRYLAEDLNLRSGSKIAIHEDPYIGARMYAGIGGRLKADIADLDKALAPMRGKRDSFEAFLFSHRAIERSRRGFANPGGIGMEESSLALKELAEKEGPLFMMEAEKSAQVLYQLGDKILNSLKSSGVLSNEAVKAIRTKNQRWTPFDVVEYLADKSDQLPATLKSFSVAEQDIVKSLIGTEKKIDRPISAYIRRLFKAEALAERNTVARKVIDLSKRQDLLGSEARKFIFKRTGSQRSPDGFSPIAVFEDGVKNEYFVPSDVADAMKGLNKAHPDFITKIITAYSGIFKAGVTTASLPFIPTNIIRDITQSAVIAKNAPARIWANWPKAFASALKKDADYLDFLRSGSALSGLIESGFGILGGRIPPAESFARSLFRTKTQRLMDSTKTVLNPFTLLSELSQAAEVSTRMAVRKSQIQSGLSDLESSFIARNASTDFSKFGTLMRVANMWVPFLNANVQGRLVAFEALKDRPVETALRMAALSEIPTVATYYWNTRAFPDVYTSLPDFIKENYWTIIWGDGRNKEGEFNQVVKIPKPELFQLSATPVERFLEFLDGREDKTVFMTAAEMLSDISPVEFVGEGKFKPGRAAGSLTNPLIRVPLEVFGNVNFYTGLPIVPRRLESVSPEKQFKEFTPEFIKTIGKATSLSPLKLEHTLRGLLGEAPFLLQGPERTARRFFVASDRSSEKDFDIVGRLRTKAADERLDIQRSAEKLFDDAKKQPSNRDKLTVLLRGVLQSQDPTRMLEKVSDVALGLSPIQRSVKSLPIEERALFVIEKLRKFETKQEAIQWLSEWQARGILTESVFNEISKILPTSSLRNEE